MPAPVKFVARKTVTHIQQDSVYKDRFTLPFAADTGTTARIIFLGSDGAQIAEIDGVVDGRYVSFREAYDTVAEVPNGALFYIYLDIGGGDPDGEDMAFYGTVFRRQHVFPDNPAITTQTVVKLFEDSFQRPAGAVGGRWKTLVGRPVIFDNGASDNTVGPQYTFYSRYFCFYYTPFNDDSVQLSISATKKGSGKTIVTLTQNSSASSYLYAGFNGTANTVELGYGTGPDIGSTISPSTVLQPQITPVSLTVPGSGTLGTYKINYDDVTKTLGIYNEDMTTTIAEWTDGSNIVPHGKGYRYFGIGGNSGLLDSGVQLAHIRAAGLV